MTQDPYNSAPGQGHRPQGQGATPYQGNQADPGQGEYGQPTHQADYAQQAGGQQPFGDYQPGRAPSRQVIGDNRNLGDLMGDISADVSTLMRQEVALAKAEIAESAKKAGTGAGMFGGAGVAAHFTLLFLSLGLWWLIAHLMSSDVPKFGWAAVIVAVIWAIIAGVLAMMGKSNLEQVDGAPRTAETVGKIPNALKGEEAKN